MSNTNSAKSGISFCIACYNSGDDILRTVHSIQKQGIPQGDYDIIIVNDGSTDPTTLNALDKIRSIENVRVIDQENQGQSAARNIALINSQREFIHFIDSDDALETDPEFIAKYGSYPIKAMADLKANPRLAFAYCAFRHFGDDNAVQFPEPYSHKRILIECGMQVIGIMRRKDALACGLFDQTMDRLEDSEFFVRLVNYRLEQGTGIEVKQYPHPYYLYQSHKHGQSVSSRDRDYVDYFSRLIKSSPSLMKKYYGSLRSDDELAQMLAERHHEQQEKGAKRDWMSINRIRFWTSVHFPKYMAGRLKRKIGRAFRITSTSFESRPIPEIPDLLEPEF